MTTGGRVALVMAASKGIGYGCAEALALGGHRLVLCARDLDGLEAAAAPLRAAGTEVESVAADVSDPAQLQEVFRRADAVHGRLDVLVANAGGPPFGDFMTVTDEHWRTGFELTLMSAVRAMRMAIPRLRQQGGGRIIIIGSSSVKQPIQNLVLSNTLRPALVGLMKTISHEVAADGITVNMVSPGRVESDRVRALDEVGARAKGVAYEEYRRTLERGIPAGRYGRPAEVGALVAFLASEQAGYITGQSILVDGGMVPGLP